MGVGGRGGGEVAEWKMGEVCVSISALRSCCMNVSVCVCCVCEREDMSEQKGEGKGLEEILQVFLRCVVPQTQKKGLIMSISRHYLQLLILIS